MKPRDNSDLTGKRFGAQVVLRFAGIYYRKRRWLVRCDCGDEREIFGTTLTSKNNYSCRACMGRRSTIHGMKDHQAYRVWANMLSRCYNPRTVGWKNYGGRGIRVCSRWRSFVAFWSDMGDTYHPGLTIERKNNDGNYTPDNCRWATRKEQAYNRRSNRRIDTPWGRMTITEAAQRLGITPMTLHSRLERISDLSIVFSIGQLPRRGRFSTKSERSHGL